MQAPRATKLVMPSTTITLRLTEEDAKKLRDGADQLRKSPTWRDMRPSRNKMLVYMMLVGHRRLLLDGARPEGPDTVKPGVDENGCGLGAENPLYRDH